MPSATTLLCLPLLLLVTHLLFLAGPVVRATSPPGEESFEPRVRWSEHEWPHARQRWREALEALSRRQAPARASAKPANRKAGATSTADRTVAARALPPLWTPPADYWDESAALLAHYYGKPPSHAEEETAFASESSTARVRLAIARALLRAARSPAAARRPGPTAQRNSTLPLAQRLRAMRERHVRSGNSPTAVLKQSAALKHMLALEEARSGERPAPGARDPRTSVHVRDQEATATLAAELHSLTVTFSDASYSPMLLNGYLLLRARGSTVPHLVVARDRALLTLLQRLGVPVLLQAELLELVPPAVRALVRSKVKRADVDLLTRYAVLERMLAAGLRLYHADGDVMHCADPWAYVERRFPQADLVAGAGVFPFTVRFNRTDAARQPSTGLLNCGTVFLRPTAFTHTLLRTLVSRLCMQASHGAKVDDQRTLNRLLAAALSSARDPEAAATTSSSTAVSALTRQHYRVAFRFPKRLMLLAATYEHASTPAPAALSSRDGTLVLLSREVAFVGGYALFDVFVRDSFCDPLTGHQLQHADAHPLLVHPSNLLHSHKPAWLISCGLWVMNHVRFRPQLLLQGEYNLSMLTEHAVGKCALCQCAGVEKVRLHPIHW
jgi:Nucleotide-diphospho-sugar transferase